jgi:hypothetical protein
MSYDINVSGEIRIDPPILAEEAHAAGFSGPGAFGDKDVAIRQLDEPVAGIPGAYRRLVTAIVPAMATYTAYHLVEHIQEILDRWGEGRTFTGRFDCSDPDTGGLWRVEVHDGRAVEVKPRIVWPDGSEEAAQ